MLKFSKNDLVKKTINGKTYKLRTWSTITTTLEGMKIAKVIAPSFSIIADLWSGKTEDQKVLEEINKEVSDNMYIFTGAVTQLCGAIDDEHFIDLSNKLLDGLYIIVDDEAKKIDDWSEHFDKHPEDFEEVLMWSVKENLLDFFMKQPTFGSKIGKLLKVMKPLQKQYEDLVEKSTQEQS